MPRSGNIFMTVESHCQVTFISTWMIHKLHKLNMFRTELIITPPHLHLFLLLSSSLLVTGMARCSSAIIFEASFPHMQSVIRLGHWPWKNSHTHLSTVLHPTATSLVPATITSHREWKDSPSMVLLVSSVFPCPQGAYLPNKLMNEKHYTCLKTQAIVYVKAAKRVFKILTTREINVWLCVVKDVN